MENKNTILTYDEMQDLLADYIFNRVSEADKVLFEKSLPNYEDIQKEIADVRAVFNRMEKMDIDKKISKHTRNLSVKVNNRLASNPRSRRFRLVNKYLIPTFGVAVIIVLFMTHDFNQKENTHLAHKTFTTQNFIKFDENDFKNLNTAELSDNLLYSDKNYLAELNSEGINSKYDETINEFFSESDLNKINNMKDLGFNSQYDLFSPISSLDEDDIQYLLEEIQNAKFNS